jgi:hypothetical protein
VWNAVMQNLLAIEICSQSKPVVDEHHVFDENPANIVFGANIVSTSF